MLTYLMVSPFTPTGLTVRGAEERESGGHTKTSKGNWLLKRGARPREEEEAKAAAGVCPLL